MSHAMVFHPTKSYSFFGEWPQKYWKNIPGPFYSTTDNMMSLLASGDDHVHLLNDNECEFIWRQPSTQKEYDLCLFAMNCDEVGSYQVDGNLHWTPTLVREWWARRGELLQWAENHLKQTSDATNGSWQGLAYTPNPKLLQEYVDFLQHDAEEYLRSYIFLLETGKPADMQDTLPNL